MSQCYCCAGKYDGRKKDGCPKCYGAFNRCKFCNKCKLHCTGHGTDGRDVDPDDYDYIQRMMERNIGAKR